MNFSETLFIAFSSFKATMNFTAESQRHVKAASKKFHRVHKNYFFVALASFFAFPF